MKQVEKLSKTFPLGRLVMTMNTKTNIPITDMHSALNRHANCDWGEVCAKDWQMNNEALETGSRLISVYTAFNGNRFRIITDGSRSSTTVLMTEDYCVLEVENDQIGC